MSTKQKAAPVATPRSRRPQPPPQPADERIRISWRHCLLGWLVGEAVLLLLTNGALDGANAAFGGTDKVDGGIVGICSFLSVMLGAYIAARLAGHQGIFQGIVVAIGFIAVYAVYTFGQEANTVHQALSGGSHSLVDLGPMRVEDVFTGDLLALIAGTFGGWLSRR